MILAVILAALFQTAHCRDGCVLEENLIVCTEREHAERMLDLLRDGDTEAFEEYSRAAALMFLVEGEGCTFWESGTYIFADYEGGFIPEDIAEVRKRGEIGRWWTVRPWIKGRG